MPFKTYAQGPDGGIDVKSDSLTPPAIIQCKHYKTNDSSKILKQAEAEASRWSHQDVSWFGFATSVDLSPKKYRDLVAKLSHLGTTEEHVWARGALNELLAKYPSIEKRHFKLWLSSYQALEQIVRPGQLVQSEALIERAFWKSKLFVETESYFGALEHLENSNFLTISGAPGVGKTTLAEIIAFNYATLGWKVVSLNETISEAWSYLTDLDEKVLFLYDDIFGQTTAAELAKNEPGNIANFVQALAGPGHQKSKILIVTTREQVLRTALSTGDDRLRREFDPSGVFRIEVKNMTLLEKARLLFNHLYYTYSIDESAEMREGLAASARYEEVLNHEAFNPRILESVIVRGRPSTPDDLYDQLAAALDNPDEIWAGSFSQLSELSTDILLLLASFRNGRLALSKLRDSALEGNARDLEASLRILEDTWVSIRRVANEARIEFVDPSRLDYIRRHLEDSRNLERALTLCSETYSILHLLSIIDRRHWAKSKRVIEKIHALGMEHVNKLAVHLNTTPASSESLKELVEILGIFSCLEPCPQLPKEFAELFDDSYQSIVSDGNNSFETELLLSVCNAVEDLSDWSDYKGPQLETSAAEWAVLAFDTCQSDFDVLLFLDLPRHVWKDALDQYSDTAISDILGTLVHNVAEMRDHETIGQSIENFEHISTELRIGIDLCPLHEMLSYSPDDEDFERYVSGSGAAVVDDKQSFDQFFAQLATS